MSQHVLVTGATGRIGRVLVPALRQRSMRVYALAREASRHVALPTAVPLDCDITDSEAMHETLRHIAVDTVVHLESVTDASHDDPDEALRINVLGTYGLLEWAAASGVSRFIFTPTRITNDITHHDRITDISMRMAERSCDLAASESMHVRCLRLTDPFDVDDAVDAIRHAIEASPRQYDDAFEITDESAATMAFREVDVCS